MPNVNSYNANQLAELVVKKYHSGDLKSALGLCQQLNRRFYDFHHGWYLASFLLVRVNNTKDALLAIDKALGLYSCDKYFLQQAQCYMANGDISHAKRVCKKLATPQFSNAGLHHELGELLSKVNMYTEALVEFEKAIALDPSHYEFYFNRGTVQRYLGHNLAAQESFDRAIELQPTDYESYLSRANLMKQTEDNNHIDQMRGVVTAPTAAASKTKSLHHVYYALAKELEDVGEYQESFRMLSTGSHLKRQQMQYNIKTDIDIIDTIIDVYSAQAMSSIPKGIESSDAIFILGMPRTGTTLVERILSSHSDISSAGELNNFSMVMMQEINSKGIKPKSRLDLITETTRLDFKQLGQAYLNSVVPLRDKKPFFIDKLPFNYLYAGLIHLAMPNAKIINLQRHPMATCYAVYKQLFNDAYPFSYSLSELGHYYAAYNRLMVHWNTVMPGVIHTVNYEQVVAETELEAKKLISYCDLEWQSECLQFHQNKHASTTASASQVRQPVYSSSVEMWRNYQNYLLPLEKILNDKKINIA